MAIRRLACVLLLACLVAVALASTEKEIRERLEAESRGAREARETNTRTDSSSSSSNNGGGLNGCRRNNLPSSFDYIVVGAGAAGCALANRLASARQNGRWVATVLLIEAGSDEEDTLLVKQPLNWQVTPGSPIDWGYTNVGGELISFDIGKRHMSGGKALGGTTTINTMMYVRGNRMDYDRWGANNPGWDYNSVLPVFKSIETSTRYSQSGANTGPAYHGNNGPLRVGPGAWVPPEDMILINAAVNSGTDIPFNSDWNGASQIGAGFHELTISGGLRQTAYKSFIKPILSQSNLWVMDHSFVNKIIFGGSASRPKAQGVVFVDNLNGNCYTVNANNEVILSAGALRSPQLLMTNGIGDSSLLSSLGINTLVHLPGVGQNLHDHPISTFTYGSVFPPAAGSAQDQAAYDLWNFNKTGIVGSITARANYFFRSKFAQDARPDAQIIVTTPGPTQFALCYLIRPRSRGFLTIHSGDPTDAPNMKLNYFQNSADLDAMIDIMNRTYKIFNTPPLAVTFGFQNLDFSSRDSVVSYLLGSQFSNGNAGTGQHFVGTCKMGPSSDPMAVVDNRLRVRGVRGLRVADASIMPEITCGNTQAPSYMIGAKAAAMILEDNDD